MTSEFQKVSSSVCCCYDYSIDVQLQNYMVCCILRVMGCVISDACHTEREYPQCGGRGKKADGLYCGAVFLECFTAKLLWPAMWYHITQLLH